MRAVAPRGGAITRPKQPVAEPRSSELKLAADAYARAISARATSGGVSPRCARAGVGACVSRSDRGWSRATRCGRELPCLLAYSRSSVPQVTQQATAQLPAK